MKFKIYYYYDYLIIAYCNVSLLIKENIIIIYITCTKLQVFTSIYHHISKIMEYAYVYLNTNRAKYSISCSSVYHVV